MHKKTSRTEWISLLYLVFFVLAVLSPSIIQHDFLGFTQTRLEELAIFLFGMAGLVTFWLYEGKMERRELERQKAEGDYQKAKNELIQSYTYIGSVNRKIELLKTMADQTTRSLADGGKLSKELFQALAANACAACGAQAGIIRFVDLTKLRTEKEFSHDAESKAQFRVANRELRALQESGASHVTVRSDDEQQVLIVPSDRSGNVKAHLLIHINGEQPSDVDISLLKVFANQAELLYQQFAPTGVVMLPVHTMNETATVA